ncbi:MAG TPA: FAD:protein FMN transferase [Cyclobacteriaceae bacterium]
MKRLLFSLLFIVSSFVVPAQNKAHTKELLLMSSRFEVTAVSENDTLAWKAINAVIAETKRIEKLISEWDSTSQTSAINRNAGVRPVVVDRELFDLIARSIKVSKLTDGAFDISFAPLYKVWKINEKINAIPTNDQIESAKKFVGYSKIILDNINQTVFLQEKGMKIGLGGIGQGYVANACKHLMVQMGIKAGLINVSGDIITWGTQPDGSNWRIGIADPKDKDAVISWLAVHDVSVVTSGNYEKFITVNGKRYGHIVDPRTGYPADHVGSVTIVSPDAELSDALATGVFVLGVDDGLNLVNQLKGVECLIIDEQNNLHPSKNMTLNFEKRE